MELQVETGVNRNIAPNFALVDMGAFKVSTARPLYTYGAGPCMNVVVHNETSDVGGLAHIAYGGMTAEVDINEKTRFDKANMVIQTMVNQTGSSNPGTTVDKVTGGTEIGLLKPEKPSLLAA